MDLLNWIRAFLGAVGPVFVAVLTIFLSIAATVHVVLYKRDTRSAVGWAGLIWLAPIIGAALYVLLGINRIKRRAQALMAGQSRFVSPVSNQQGVKAGLAESLGQEYGYLKPLERLVGLVSKRPLLDGNRVEPLINGDEAFPAMVEAIDAAQMSVSIQTYIFDNDHAGGLFLHAIRKAVSRGVDVRVIIDALGSRYSIPPITRKLRRTGARVERFLPTVVPWRFPFMNLRNHRKIMVVDGRMGFTGGMNIRESLMLEAEPRRQLRDLHFRLEGPVVGQLQDAFASDWYFCTGERLEGEEWFPELPPAGEALARGIPDGPDEDFEQLYDTVHGALSVARRSVIIMTPYFLPDNAMISSLNTASMRGVQVDIVLPGVNNFRVVKWASTHQLWQLLQQGCRVWLSPPPFDHSKLMLVDGVWVLFGSGNWDPRSFRLNFEFNVECYDPSLAANLGEFMSLRKQASKEITLEDVNSRSLPVKLRDGLSRLFAPYL